MDYSLALLAVGVFAIIGWLVMFCFSSRAKYSRKGLARWWRRKRRYYINSSEKIKSLP